MPCVDKVAPLASPIPDVNPLAKQQHAFISEFIFFFYSGEPTCYACRYSSNQTCVISRWNTIAFKLQQTYSTNIKSVFAELALTKVAAQQTSEKKTSFTNTK